MRGGLRVTGFITDTPAGVVPGQLAGLDLRHRQHARVEDRIRQAKATGMRNFPCHSYAANNAWLEIVMTAMDLVAWTKLLGFADQPDLATCEIATFRYRVLHVAARITRSARQTRLRIDHTWRWAEQIAASLAPGSAPRSPEPGIHPSPSDPKTQPPQVEPAPTRHDSRAQPRPITSEIQHHNRSPTRSTDQTGHAIEVRLDYFDFEVDKQSVPLTALRHRRPRSRMPT